MVTFSFNVSEATAAELVQALCYLHRYQPVIDGAPNPETPAEFTRRQLVQTMNDTVIRYRERRAAELIDRTPPDIAPV
jgi:hypothetical protein